MKKVNNAVKSVILAALVMLMLAVANHAIAGNVNNNTKNKNKSQNTIETRLLGLNNQQPVYLVQFLNEAEQDLQIILIDADGNRLYSEDFNGSFYSRKFQFADDRDDAFEIIVYNKTTKSSRSFIVERNGVQR